MNKIQPVGRGVSAAREKNDCVVRALANAQGTEYWAAHALCKAQGRKDRARTPWSIVHRAYSASAASLVGVYGTTRAAVHHARVTEAKAKGLCKGGTTLGTLLPRLGSGRFVVLITGHVLAVIDGQVIDTFASLAGTSVIAVYKV